MCNIIYAIIVISKIFIVCVISIIIVTKVTGYVMEHKVLTIRLETYERLLRRKKVPDETMNTVIIRLLDGENNVEKR